MNLTTFLEKVKRKLLIYAFKINYKPYKQKTIIFESFGGRQISDSPLAIYEELKKSHPDYQLVWVINRGLEKMAQANGYDYVIRGSFKWVKVIEKAQIWVENARLPQWVRKPEHVKIIQTWHGTPLKKLGLDIENVMMPGTTTEKYHENFVQEANRWDYLISPNEYATQIFRKAFGYENKILEIGYPRNDELAQPSEAVINKIKQRLGIPADKKVVLYAPTYRDNQFFTKGKYSFQLPFDLKQMQAAFGKDTVLLLRMHYLISNAMDLSDMEGFAYDVSSYSNISDLYLISDLLVTDYSSVFFDYAYLKRPIVFFPYDFEVYKDELRGFYLDYTKDLPGEIAYDVDALLENIVRGLRVTDMASDESFMKFYNRFCKINAGNASKRVVEEIDDILKER